MPNPRGPLSRAMPLPAITAANKEILLLEARSVVTTTGIQLTQENRTALLAAISTSV